MILSCAKSFVLLLYTVNSAKISCPLPSDMRKKIILMCYLNSGMGSINIPTEDLSRHKIRCAFLPAALSPQALVSE